MLLKKITVASCVALAAGCSAQPAADASASNTPNAAAAPGNDDQHRSNQVNGRHSAQVEDSARDGNAVSSKNTTTTSPDNHSVMSECGSAKMKLECTAKSEACDASTLWIESGTAPRRVAAKPSGMEKYTPTGLACATSKQGDHLFIVQYGELPFGCKFCEWFHLYDQSGKPLTASSPAVIQMDGRDPTQAQTPNNTEFDVLSKKMQLDDPEIHYVN